MLAAGFHWLEGGVFLTVLALSLAGSVFAAVHHAEVVAHRVGEPFGSLVLALSVTLIEVSLIVSLMLAGGPQAAALARDTLFATVMIILTGILGLCLLLGGLKHREQTFSLDGVSAALVALGAIVIMTLVLPDYTVTTPGPFYSPSQLVLIAIVSLIIYAAFIFTQTFEHRGYFVVADAAGENSEHAAPPPSNAVGRGKRHPLAGMPDGGGIAGEEARAQSRIRRSRGSGRPTPSSGSSSPSSSSCRKRWRR